VTNRDRGLAPSIIAADMGRFADALRTVEPFSARWHVDVMDGHYVPNLTIGPPHVEAIAAISALPQDVHLMITNPDRTWEWYAKPNVARIAFHPETSSDPSALLESIARLGIGPGLAVNPEVEPREVEPYLGLVEHLIVMSVHPGFSGQQFIPSALPKLRSLRAELDATGRDVHLIIDGGVNLDNAPDCVRSGADVLVSASSVFHASDPAGAAGRLAAVASASKR
jgi:ribulose-phosphate 3-epimerase